MNRGDIYSTLVHGLVNALRKSDGGSPAAAALVVEHENCVTDGQRANSLVTLGYSGVVTPVLHSDGRRSRITG